MKRLKRLITLLLTISIVASLFAGMIVVSAATTPSAHKLSATTQNATKELSSGVRYTQLTANSGTKYGGSSGIEFNVVEADMSANNLYLDTVYGGATCSHAYKKGTAIVKAFDSANSSLKPIAAINADGWWLYTNTAVEYSNGKKMLSGTGGLATPVGFTMSNGEIYASDRMPQESFKSSSANLPYEDQISFGITSDFVPVISNPNAQITIKNTSKNTTAYADGINRLPAYNSLVMYTDKGPANNYSNDDAFEVKIKITSTNDYVIKHGTDITGTVESIHAPGASNPTMTANSNYIILTGRGSQYNSVSGYKKGDTVNIKVSIFDQYGKYTSQWQKVTDAVCGHIPFVTDGKAFTPGIESNYPATIIGITNSGNVVMLTSGATKDGSRKGLNQATYADLARELNLKDSFFLDGGGSSSMVLPSGGNYPMVNHYADSTGERQVPDMLILSTGPSRLAQGKIPATPKKSDNITTLDFSNPANHIYVGEPSDTVATYENNALKLTVPSGYDPYITLDYTKASSKVTVTKNKFITIEYMLPKTNQAETPRSMIYGMCGSVLTADKAVKVTSDKMVRDGEYHKVTIDMSKYKTWTGNLNKIRLDYFTTGKPGDVMFIKSIAIGSTAPTVSTVAPSATANVTPSAGNTVTEAPATTPGTATIVPDVTETVPVDNPDNVSEAPTETSAVSGNGTDNKTAGKDSDKGLTIGAFIGIVAGVVVVLIAIMTVVMILIKKKQLSKK
ncbi:MAG: phosphodiester glycosidase family protein [Ruminococcaceae bacterium]|nr:phosphodiester glycosidase family protein [Oscillospiraceae bacterium]